MFRLALKNLWNRRGRYGWLFAELIIASILSWPMIDHLLVTAYMSNPDYGYDHDRLLLVMLSDAEIDVAASPFEPATRVDADSRAADLTMLSDRIAEVDGVESVIRIPQPYLECIQGGSALVINDSTYVFSSKLYYYPGTRYFSTYGLRRADVTGNPSLDELDYMPLAPGEAIVTRSVAEILYGDAAASFAASRRAAAEWEGEDYARPEIICGIVEDVLPRTSNISRCVRFCASADLYGSYLLVRAEPGVRASDLVGPLTELGLSGVLSRGAYHFREAVTYRTLADRSVGDQNTEFFVSLLAVFFLINLFLGVLGTFWLMTRKRSEEVGIVRSFGFAPTSVRRLLMTEGAVLTFVSWIIGTAIFFFIVYSIDPTVTIFTSDLPSGVSPAIWGTSDFPLPNYNLYFTSWINDFRLHFSISAAVTLSVLMVVVLMAIAIPARRLSRVNPVDALRNE